MGEDEAPIGERLGVEGPEHPGAGQAARVGGGADVPDDHLGARSRGRGPEAAPLAEGESVRLTPDMTKAHLFEAGDNGANITASDV